MTEQERILYLREQLHEHNRRYYVENSPIISDQEFDLMMHELQDLETKHPELYDPNSPTMRVGSDITKEFKQVRHRYPMLSLANTYNEQDVEEWYNQVKKGLEGEDFEVCCEMKYDGLSISLTYEDGRLVQAVTRGDGVQGDDVTTNVRTIRSIPLILKQGLGYPRNFEIRGEILMPWSSFNRLNEEREEIGAQPLSVDLMLTCITCWVTRLTTTDIMKAWKRLAHGASKSARECERCARCRRFMTS